MNINTAIVDVAHGLDERGNLGVLNFAVLATSDSGESYRFEVSRIGGTYPPPADPRTPVTEPVMGPTMEPILEPVFEDRLGEDGEMHAVMVGERQVGERQIGEHQVGERIVGYTGGYTPEELAAIAATVAEECGAHIAARSKMETMLTVSFIPAPPPVDIPTDDERKQMLADQIDGKVAYIYRQFTRFQVEYELREAAARAYKEAGYTGPLGPLVADYAESSGMSNQQAADATIYMADQLRAALPQLGVLRMRKNRVQRAATLSDAQNEFQAIMADIEQIERGLP